MTKCGIAMLQASPTAMSRQAIFLNIKIDRIPYFDIRYSLFDILRFRKLLIKPIITMATVSSVCKDRVAGDLRPVYILAICHGNCSVYKMGHL